MIMYVQLLHWENSSTTLLDASFFKILEGVSSLQTDTWSVISLSLSLSLSELNNVAAEIREERKMPGVKDVGLHVGDSKCLNFQEQKNMQWSICEKWICNCMLTSVTSLKTNS
jgi:hypothetical protein